MKIKKLTMYNFGVYASTNILEFKGKKPIVLIGGMNGRGKTTILEAVLLSLYGGNSFAYKESKYATYGQYLKSYVNKADRTLETYVEIEFSMDAAGKETYCVRRNWDAKGLRVRERISVKKNGEENAFLTENWSMFVENILPSALSNFFFFDGEKIAELAVEETSGQMKESIKAMLGITVLDILQSDVGKIVRKISKETAGNQDLQMLEELRSAKEDAERRLEQADSNIAGLQAELEKLQHELEQLNNDYSVKGGGIFEQNNQLMKQRSESLASITGCQDQLLEMAGGELPLALVTDLLVDIEAEGKLDRERKINSIALDKIKTAYSSFASKSTEVNDFIDYMKEEMSGEDQKETYNLSGLSLLQLGSLNSSGISTEKKKARDLIAKRNQQQRRIDDIDNSLSVEIDEQSLRDLFEQIRVKERAIFEKQIEIDVAIKERSSINGTLMAAGSKFGKYAEKTLVALESADTDERTVKYAHMAIEIIKLYRIRLQERKTDILAQTMTECYKKLANKKNLVDHIKMDSDTLDLHYMNSEGEEIAKKRLSAGEKQLMVISLLWALAICSKKKLPVIIDTPLSRLDSSHRQALIKTYFPKASDQTIILSTDSEIDENHYGLMKRSIGDKFTLKYNDKTKNTTIEEGYFGWGGNEE